MGASAVKRPLTCTAMTGDRPFFPTENPLDSSGTSEGLHNPHQMRLPRQGLSR